MPSRALRRCAHAGCTALSATGFCAAHAADANRLAERRRGTAAERGYGSRWQKARRTYLLSHPLCVACQAEDRLTPATVVDHIRPHRGDQTLFWDAENWQALCAACHNRKTAAEDGGYGNTPRGAVKKFGNRPVRPGPGLARAITG